MSYFRRFRVKEPRHSEKKKKKSQKVLPPCRKHAPKGCLYFRTEWYSIVVRSAFWAKNSVFFVGRTGLLSAQKRLNDIFVLAVLSVVGPT